MVDDEARSPREPPNPPFHLDNMAVIQELVCLPAEVNAIQVRHGCMGVAANGSNVLVAF
jgi:hypothetical protein